MADWTDERIETLRKLWAEGLTCSQIAARFGDVSRNAVIGKVHRLGLAGRAMIRTKGRGTWTPAKRRAAAKKAAATRSRTKRSRLALLAALPLNGRVGESSPVPPTPLPMEVDPPIPLEQRRTVATLTQSCCRWPIGDPQHEDFHFCGAPRTWGFPYCARHTRRAYNSSPRIETILSAARQEAATA